MARILIAGCGDLGTALGLLLVTKGHEVWGLRRRADLIPPALRAISADLCETTSLGGIPEGLDAVYYCAAAGGHAEEDHVQAYAVGPVSLCSTLRRRMVSPQVFYVSSTGVYGQDDGTWVDEESPAEPASFRGRHVLTGERAFRQLTERATAVRLGGIYGPGRIRLVNAIREGRGTFAEDAPHYTNRIHRDDAARALAFLLEVDDPAGVYLAVDDDPAPRAEVHRWIARHLGLTLPGAIEDDPDRARGGRNKRCRNERLRSTGFEFLYPTYREGYAQLLGPAPAGSTPTNGG